MAGRQGVAGGRRTQLPPSQLSVLTCPVPAPAPRGEMAEALEEAGLLPSLIHSDCGAAAFIEVWRGRRGG